jgi:hypothetical protein
METTAQKTDITSRIIGYECGDLSQAEIIYLFADLIKNGMAWSLQGHYGRTASALIDSGIITETGDIDEMAAIEMGIEM